MSVPVRGRGRFDADVLVVGTGVAGLTAALGAAGLVRVDMMLDLALRPWVLEVNTVPGMTDHSLAPQAAAWAGLELHALCDWMIRDCLALEVVP